MVDECVDQQIVEALRFEGHFVVYIKEVARRSLDEEVINRANDENAILVTRLFNPTKDRIQGTLRVSFGLARASLVNLNEEFVESLLDMDGTIDFSIKGGQIMTFSLVPKRAVR